MKGLIKYLHRSDVGTTTMTEPANDPTYDCEYLPIYTISNIFIYYNCIDAVHKPRGLYNAVGWEAGGESNRLNGL